MKKFFALFLAMAMIVSMFAACGGSAAPAATQPKADAPAADAPAADAPAAPAAPAEVKWPESSVQLVCAYAAGGGTDIICRTLAEGLAKYGNFGVVNLTDGGGVVGWEQVRTSDPKVCDQLIFALNSMFLSYLSGVSDIHPMEDIVPVFGMVSGNTNFVVVNKNAPYNTLEELIEYGKANPGKLTLGAGAPGSTMTIYTAQFIDSTGLDCRLAATSGSDSEAVAMVMGGNLDIYLCNQATTLTYLEAGEVKVLAGVKNISDKAPDILKAIPSLEDLGYENVKMGASIIVWAPKGADAGVYEKMNELFTNAFNDPEIVAAFAERGSDYTPYGNLAETQAALVDEYAACEAAWNDYMASQG